MEYQHLYMYMSSLWVTSHFRTGAQTSKYPHWGHQLGLGHRTLWSQQIGRGVPWPCISGPGYSLEMGYPQVMTWSIYIYGIYIYGIYIYGIYMVYIWYIYMVYIWYIYMVYIYIWYIYICGIYIYGIYIYYGPFSSMIYLWRRMEHGDFPQHPSELPEGNYENPSRGTYSPRLY